MRAAEGWGVLQIQIVTNTGGDKYLGGLTGASPAGVSARMWKWEVGGGPMAVGRASMSTWKICSFRTFIYRLSAGYMCRDATRFF